MKNKILVSWVIVSLLVFTGNAIASIYDAVSDFSSTDNPNRVWSYGWSETLGSTFHRYTNQAKNPGGVDVWYESGNQLVAHNGTGVASIAWPVDQLGFHPGQNNVYSVIRWTAPNTEIYTINATFIGSDNATTDVHVLNNGNSLFQGDINGFGSTAQFSPTSIAINAGDTIDFAVGWGANGNINSDTTGVSATISSVPIPSTILLFGSALTGLLFRGRRQHVRAH
jgi:hypothetical protein